MWKARKLFAYFLIATYLKIVVKRHMIIISEKYPTSSNWYFSMTFTDFQWLFQAKCHFSRPTSNSMTFQGKIEIPWLFQACTNHGQTQIFGRYLDHFLWNFPQVNATRPGWETKICWYLPELGSLLYSLYKIPLAQACFPLALSNFHSHWRAGER